MIIYPCHVFIKIQNKNLKCHIGGVLVVDDLGGYISNPKWTYIQNELYQTYKFILF